MKRTNTTATTPTGVILLSQKRCIGTKQTAWTDDAIYEAPFTGSVDQNKMHFALLEKLGSNRISVQIEGINHETKVVTFRTSYYIGN